MRVIFKDVLVKKFILHAALTGENKKLHKLNDVTTAIIIISNSIFTFSVVDVQQPHIAERKVFYFEDDNKTNLHELKISFTSQSIQIEKSFLSVQFNETKRYVSSDLAIKISCILVLT